MTNTTEAALRDTLERISKIAEMHRSKDGNRSGTPTYYDMQRIIEVTDATLASSREPASVAWTDQRIIDETPWASPSGQGQIMRFMRQIGMIGPLSKPTPVDSFDGSHRIRKE